jgi:hypothetical protein
MKQIKLAVIILFMLMAGMGVWAHNAQADEKNQLALDHGMESRSGRHVKKVKPVRRVGGTAKRGARQVSPPVMKK